MIKKEVIIAASIVIAVLIMIIILLVNLTSGDGNNSDKEPIGFWSNFSLVVPDTIEAGDSEKFEIVLKLRSQFSDRLVETHLASTDFEVLEEPVEEVWVNTSELTIWVWSLKAKKAGLNKLKLTLLEDKKVIGKYEKTIFCKGNVSIMILVFLKEHWFALFLFMAGIVIPILLNKKSKNTLNLGRKKSRQI